MNQIGAIQILRALAALMVVFSHAQDDALITALKSGVAFTRFALLPLDAGVDLFFVISGFIMVHASGRLFGVPGAAGTFLIRRLIRIVPLYWMITAIGLVISGYVAWTGKHAFPSFSEITASLSFVPFARPEDGEPRPLVSLGWTLNYEMFFYVIFALFIRFRRAAAVAGVVLILALIAGLGAFSRPSSTAFAYWSDPIVLEFALGSLMALARERGFRLQRRLVLPLVLGGLALLALDLDGMTMSAPAAVETNGFIRLFACGLPMAVIFGAIVFATPAFPARGGVLGLLAFFGDASYALYLFHPLVIVFARKAYLAMGLSGTIGFWPLIAADIPMALGLAILVHLYIEKPVTRSLQSRISARSGIEPAAPAGIGSSVHP